MSERMTPGPVGNMPIREAVCVHTNKEWKQKGTKFSSDKKHAGFMGNILFCKVKSYGCKECESDAYIERTIFSSSLAATSVCFLGYR
jgi:hypothetical protein